MAQISPIKQGDTFGPMATYTNAAGVPIDVTNIQIASQVRDGNGTLIATLVVSKLNQTTYPGQYSLNAATDSWPVNRQLMMDIRYIENGAVVHTDTLTFRVEPAQTRI